MLKEIEIEDRLLRETSIGGLKKWRLQDPASLSTIFWCCNLCWGKIRKV